MSEDSLFKVVQESVTGVNTHGHGLLKGRTCKPEGLVIRLSSFKKGTLLRLSDEGETGGSVSESLRDS